MIWADFNQRRNVRMPVSSLLRRHWWIVSDGPSPTKSYYDEIQTRMADNPVSSVSRASTFNLSPLKITPETPPQAWHHTNNNNNAAAAGHGAIFCFWTEPALDPFYHMTLHRIYFETHW